MYDAGGTMKKILKNMLRKPSKKLRSVLNTYQQAKIYADKEMFWQSMSRKISPGLIEEFPEYIKLNKEILCKCLVVGVPHFGKVGYPKKLNPHVMDELLSLSTQGFTIAYSFTTIPIDTNKSMRLLDDALYYTDVNQEAHKRNEERVQQEIVLDRQEYLELYEQLHKGSEKLFHTALFIVIWAKDEEELRTAEGMIKNVLEANRITYEIPFYQMLTCFLAAQPYPISTDIAWRELTSHACASLAAMRNPNSRTDETGLYFGEDKKTGKSIVVDLGKMAAQHLMFVGPTGSGKTFTLMMLLMRSFGLLGKRVIYITPKPDVTTNYRAVAEYYGDAASIIDIGPSGRNINPLEIMYDAQTTLDELSQIRAFDDHVELVDQFFTVLFEGTKTVNMSSYINETLIECYRQKGISRENPDTWKNAEWPTLLDLRSIWLEDAKDPRDVTAKALVDKTFKVNTSWSYMNRPSDIDMSRDFIVVDISNVPLSLQEAMNVFVTGIMGMRFRTDAKKETIIAVDEARVFLLNPKLSTFMMRTLTQGRSFNIALWLATQQTADLVRAGVDEEFKTNMPISIVLGNMRKDTLEHIKTFYKLNNNDINNLMSCGVGEGLLLVGSEVIPTTFRPTQHEMAVIKGRIGMKKQVEKTVADGVLKALSPLLQDLIAEHGIYFEDWLLNPLAVSQPGFESRSVQRAVGRGTINAWIRSSMIQGDMVMNQSIDHYTNVLYIAGYLRVRGIISTVNHNEGPDVVAEIGNKKIAFEYEKAGSHDLNELIQKKQIDEKQFSNVFFIGSLQNIGQLVKAVGSENAVRRGLQLEELIEDIINTKTV
jgi:hypothetical protein